MSALGFSTADEVVKFCLSTNVFEAFSGNNLIPEHINDQDRQELVKFGKTRSQHKLAPTVFIFKSSAEVFNFKTNPDYGDFFQFVYTWLTNGNTPANRTSFIDWYNEIVGVTSPYSNFRTTPNTLTAPVLVSFKEKVDNFLNELRNRPKSKNESSGSPFVDAVHWLPSKILRIFLTESDLKYVSGDDVTVGISTGLAELGVAGTGGYYYVYNKNKPDEKSQMRFLQIGITGGISISTPIISLGVNHSAISSRGNIYAGWSDVNKPSDLAGLYIYLSSSYGLVANVNSGLVFFLPVGVRIPKDAKEGATDAALFLAALIGTIASSKAVMLVSGHAIETALGAGASTGYGYVYVK